MAGRLGDWLVLGDVAFAGLFVRSPVGLRRLGPRFVAARLGGKSGSRTRDELLASHGHNDGVRFRRTVDSQGAAGID